MINIDLQLYLIKSSLLYRIQDGTLSIKFDFMDWSVDVPISKYDESMECDWTIFTNSNCLLKIGFDDKDIMSYIRDLELIAKKNNGEFYLLITNHMFCPLGLYFYCDSIGFGLHTRIKDMAGYIKWYNKMAQNSIPFFQRDRFACGKQYTINGKSPCNVMNNICEKYDQMGYWYDLYYKSVIDYKNWSFAGIMRVMMGSNIIILHNDDNILDIASLVLDHLDINNKDYDIGLFSKLYFSTNHARAGVVIVDKKPLNINNDTFVLLLNNYKDKLKNLVP